MATQSATPTLTPKAAEAPAPEAAPKTGPRNLDDLARMGSDELMSLYRSAKTPRVDDLNGQLRGRMLAVPGYDRLPLVPSIHRVFTATRLFPWRGKNFESMGEGKGAGKNRIIFDSIARVPFTTSVRPSRAGPFEAVELDYSDPKNLFVVRGIKDEVREVAPGLWLGLAYMRAFGRDRLACFFGLQK